jgi:hypothetical protein
MNNIGTQHPDEKTDRTVQAAQNINQTRNRAYFARTGIAMLVCASVGQMHGQSAAFVPFGQFIARTTATVSAGGLRQQSAVASRPVVVGQAEFERMRGHVLDPLSGRAGAPQLCSSGANIRLHSRGAATLRPPPGRTGHCTGATSSDCARSRYCGRGTADRAIRHPVATGTGLWERRLRKHNRV